MTYVILFDLLAVLLAAKVGGVLFERLRQPAVIGELLAGIVIGPGLLGLIGPSETLHVVAEMGVIVLMFVVGLETKPTELLKVGRTALIVAVAGVVIPFGAGLVFGDVLGMSGREGMFVGAALVATSVGITARVLADRGLIERTEARVILAAAVIDDVLGMIVLSGVSGPPDQAVDLAGIARQLLIAAVFVGVAVFVLPRLVSRHAHRVAHLPGENAAILIAILAMLAAAAISESIGLAGIVGAFFAGMAFADEEERFDLVRAFRPLYHWLVPCFFVVTGMQVRLAVLADPAVLLPGLVLVLIAFASKLLGGGLGALGMGWRPALAVGIGMVPRGEVGLIVAATGLTAGIVSDSVYAMVVLVVTATTLLSPPLLAAVFPWACTAPVAPAGDLVVSPDLIEAVDGDV